MTMKNRFFYSFLLIPVLAVALFWANQGRADAPQGRYIITDLTVTDTKTGLIWQRDVSSQSVSILNANEYCTTLALEGAKWRSPTMKELQTVVDETLSNPAIDPIAFPNTPVGEFWTSSFVAPGNFNGWTVNFADGKTNNKALFGDVAYVRCVR